MMEEGSMVSGSRTRMVEQQIQTLVTFFPEGKGKIRRAVAAAVCLVIRLMT